MRMRLLKREKIGRKYIDIVEVEVEEEVDHKSRFDEIQGRMTE